MPLSASHPLARHAPEHWPGIGWNAGPASPESALAPPTQESRDAIRASQAHP